MRHAHHCAVLLLTVVTANTGFAQDQRPTIPELVARGWGLSPSFSCGFAPLPPFSDLLHQADLLVVGTLGQPRSYLSDDQRNVYTDHPLDSVRVYYDAAASASADTSTGAAVLVDTPMAVTELGGTIIVSGRSFTQVVQYAGLRPLTTGMTGLFLLKRRGHTFWLTDPTLGAFEIERDQLRPLVARDDFAREYRNLPADAAIQAMLDILHRQ